MICPRYHYLRENQCVPLFDTLSGLELNVKIQVTPDREIGDNIAPEFETKLTDMLKHIWKKSGSLRVRNIFVMYLLNKQRNRKIYYVFNTYLYSSTGEIRFNEAIKDTKSLFTEMKRQVMLPLSNGINVGLKTEFAHKISAIQRSFVDLSNGNSLIVMKKLAWEQRTRRPVFEISETHWCYRAGFSLKEIKFTGINIIKINPSVTVYSTEFDFDIRTENIFICIDLLVTPINAEDIRPASEPEADSDNDIDEANEESGGVIGTLIVCSVVVFVLFVIFCIVGVVAKRKTNTGLPTEQSTNRFDTNTDQLPEQIEINMRHGLPTALSLDKRNDELDPNLSVNNKTKWLQHGTRLRNQTL